MCNFCVVCKWSGEDIHMWRHICFERKRGDDSTTNYILKTTDHVLNIHGLHVFTLNQWYY